MKERFNIHQHITDQIVETIERGASEFSLPWNRGGNILRPTNIESGKPYQGVNVVALWATSELRGFNSGVFGTYRQWTEKKARVRKGERASYVVFYKEYDVAQDGETESSTRLVARATPVFAAEQVDGYTAPVIASPEPVEPIAACETFVAATKAILHHGGDRAFYRPSTDEIHLPNHEAFTGSKTRGASEAYYGILLHELTHWTSHPSRCARELGKRFGDSAYAMEELVAELGAAFLCADLGIAPEPRPDHAQYLASWLDVLKGDNRAIFTAASKASEAARFLAGLQPTAT